MGARPMARLIQATIKTPLADEVLFGKLKIGGAVRVIVLKPRERAKRRSASSIPEGPVTPKPESDVTNAVKKRPKRIKPLAFGKSRKPNKPKGPGGGGGVRTVPKVPLVRV